MKNIWFFTLASLFCLLITSCFDDSSSTRAEDVISSSATETSSSSTTTSSSSYFANNNTFTDARDGQSYATTTIGTQVWMAENLNYEASSGSYCYNDIESKCDTYGRLYTWAAAMDIDAIYNTTEWTGSDANHQGICPTGWHLPSDDDWDVLLNYVIDNTSATDYTEAGPYLKTESGWSTYSGISSSDEFGFSGLPGGLRLTNGSYDFVGVFGYWWSSTEFSGSYAHSRNLSYSVDFFNRDYYYMTHAYSVRCLQDTP